MEILKRTLGKFIFIHNWLMKLSDVKSQNGGVQNNSDLTRADVDIILKVIANSTFVVKDIESLYGALYRLQELRNKLL
jgi:hypothetical protein